MTSNAQPEHQVATETRLSGLDGLRAIAVLMVLLFHQQIFELGWIGVQIFFVLSGFLITRILVHTKGLEFKAYLKAFYGRRSLRIFPLYFGVIILFALAARFGLQAQGLKEGLPFAATYTYNFWHATNTYAHSKLIAHFWSLCVEEQFYLVWPFFIYFCQLRVLRKALIAIIILGPLVRLGLYALLKSAPWANVDTTLALYVSTPAHVDAFATGALLSLYPLGGKPRLLLLSLLALLGAGLLVMLGHPGLGLSSLGYPLGLPDAWGFVWGYSLLNLSAALLLDCIVHRRIAPRFFESKVPSFVGKISYGVYVFHYPFQSLLAKALPSLALPLAIAVQIVLTVAVASASYYLWEMPFLRKKDIWFSTRPKHG